MNLPGILLSVVVALLVATVATVLFLRSRFQKKRRQRFTVGFFHPYCNAGGGGERVLWCAILGVQQTYKDVSILVYTGDDVQAEDMVKKVKATFGIEFPYPDNIDFVHLTTRHWVEKERYPYFTMIGQSLGSLVLGWEAISKVTPHVMLDTMGYAFTYPLFKILGGFRVGCYVHYPTISTDMLSAVVDREAAVNNNVGASGSPLKRFVKIWYYKLFALLYKFVGKFADTVMVNSTWTAGHIRSLWGTKVRIVYPPCDTSRFKAIPLKWKSRSPMILSIAQFRPEKDHPKQIEALDILFKKHPEHRQETLLVLVGSCRNEEDRQRIENLRKMSRDANIQSSVVFEVGINIERLTELLGTAMVGIHTMKNEHFGIGVVELSAAGVIPVAHDSAGPKEDIVLPGKTGFLATTAEQYADFIHAILSNRSQYEGMQQAGREYVERFSQEKFLEDFKDETRTLINNALFQCY